MKKINIIISIVLSVMYFLYRITNSIRVNPFFDNFDSPEYFKFSIYPSFRLQGITFFYNLLKTNDNIVLFQTVLGTFCWIIMSLILTSLVESEKFRIIFYFLLLYLGSTSVVIEHDASILSESISISALTLLIGSFTKYYFTNKRFFGIFTLTSIIFFASTKSNNFLIAIILFLILTTLFLNRRTFKFNVLNLSIYLMSLFMLIFFTLVSLSSDITKTLTTSGTINNRIILNDEWRNEIIKSGYPLKAYESWQFYSKGNFGSPADQAVVDRTDFKDWWENNGDTFLINFTLRNPDYALIAPFLPTHYFKQNNYKKSILSGWSQGTDLKYNYEGYKNSIAIRTLFFPDQAEYAYLIFSFILLVIGGSILMSHVYFKNENFAMFLSFFCLVIFSWGLINWWFGSKPADMARHQLLASISFRVLFILSLILISNKLLTKCKNVKE